MGADPDGGRLTSVAPRPDTPERGGLDNVVAAARDGEGWAIAALYREIHPRLLRYLRAREPRMADDLASEVWLDVAAGIWRFEGTEGGFRAWVFTIARRRVIDARRRAVRRPADPLDGHDVPTRPAEDPEDVVLAALGAQAAVDRIAAVLTPDQAEVVLLRVLGGLAVAQVAEVLGKQPNAVRVIQHRALRRLAQHFTVAGTT